MSLEDPLPNFLVKVTCPNCGKVNIRRRDRHKSNLCRKCFAEVTKVKRIDKDTLLNLYINKNMTSREIGNKIGVSHRSILNWLKYYNIPPHDLKWKKENGKFSGYWKGKKLPEKIKKKISKTRKERGIAKGSNNPNWRGGISRYPYPFEFNNELKYKIFKRDNFTCQLCSVYPTNDLVVHHIDYNKSNLDLKNLITLCRRCNSKVNTKREYWQIYFTNQLLKRSD